MGYSQLKELSDWLNYCRLEPYLRRVDRNADGSIKPDALILFGSSLSLATLAKNGFSFSMYSAIS